MKKLLWLVSVFIDHSAKGDNMNTFKLVNIWISSMLILESPSNSSLKISFHFWPINANSDAAELKKKTNKPKRPSVKALFGMYTLQ